MIDELELAFDDRDDRRSRHRRSSQRRKKKRRGRGRSFAAFLLTLVLLAALGGGVWWGFDRVQGYFTTTPDYSGQGTGEAMVQVKRGDTATDIGNTLVTNKVIKSAAAFIEAAQAEPLSKNIQPGTYRLRLQMKASAALAMLLDLKNKVATGITIPEGRSAKQTYALLAEKTKIPVAEFEAAGKDPSALGVADFWFTRGDGKPVRKSIEGFLFPDTYEFDPDATAEQILSRMVERFNAVATELDFVSRVEQERNISPYEALIVASLAQAEAGIAADLGKVARVAYNRAYVERMPLQFDVTANYWLELQGKKPQHSGELSPAELDDPKNPYNTVSKLGLPVGPISNPGKAALTGAMDPPKGTWLYFVAIDKTGKSAFATSYADHQRNIQTACANGVPLC